MAKSELRATVRGRVQGVFFRANVRKQARHLQLEGYVQNLADGSVAVVAQGDRQALSDLLEFVRSGPGLAQVTEVESETGEAEEEYDGFDIRY